MGALLHLVNQELFETYKPIRVHLPYKQGNLISLFHESGQIESEEHIRGGVIIQGRIPLRHFARLQPFISFQAGFDTTGSQEWREDDEEQDMNEGGEGVEEL